MKMKPFLLFVLASVLLLMFSSCSYVSYKDYYTDIKDYSKIWELSGFSYEFDGVSVIFPENIDDLEVKKFFCRYDQQLPLGEGVQLLLEIKYDDVSFYKETDRIYSLAYSCDDYFSESSYLFYATRLCESDSSEYAVIDKENFTVYYIYLQSVPKDEIEFSYEFLPDGYSGYGEILN